MTLSPALIKGHNYTWVCLGLYANANSSDNLFLFFSHESTAHSRDDWFQRQVVYEESD